MDFSGYLITIFTYFPIAKKIRYRANVGRISCLLNVLKSTSGINIGVTNKSAFGEKKKGKKIESAEC